MRRSVILGILVSASALLVTAFAVALPMPSRDTLTLPYWQARAAGLAVGPTPAELGIPECTPTPDPGFASAAQAERVTSRIDAKYGEAGGPKPECMTHPARSVISVGPIRRLSSTSSLSAGLDQAEWAVVVARAWTKIAVWRLAGSPRLASSWVFTP